MATSYFNKASGMWLVKFYWQHRAVYKSFKTEVDAVHYKELVEADLKASRAFNRVPQVLSHLPPAKASIGCSNPTKEDFWNKFVAHTEATHGAQTLRSYLNAWRSLQRFCSFRRIADLTPEHIRRWQTEAQRQNAKMREKPLSLASVNSYLRRLRVMFNLAVAEQMLLVSPCKGVKFIRADRFDPKPYLTKEEINSVLYNAQNYIPAASRAAKESGDLTALEVDEQEHADGYGQWEPLCFVAGTEDIVWVFALGIFAGMRLNEILNCRWEWVQESRDYYSGGSITVQSGHQFRLKARQARTIPLHENLRPLLKSKQELGPTGYIIKPEVTEWKPTSYRWDCRKQFEGVLRQAGLMTVNRYGRDEHVTPHVLRHTFCSMLAQAGYSAYEIMKAAGHSDIRVAEAYMHLAPHEKGFKW